MSKIQQKSGKSKTRAAMREEQPVTGIRRAAARAGIAPFSDITGITIAKGDLEYVASELTKAFDDVFDAEAYPEGGERDARVFSALRRIRGAREMLDIRLSVCGGAS